MMKKLVSAPYLLWMAIFIIVPLIMVAYFALTDTNGAFTLDNLAAVSQYSNIFIRSIWLAAVATVICLIIAYPLALILANTDKSYKKLPKFPSTQRDLALIADNGVLAAQIEGIIKKKAGNIFESLTLFDVYKGKQVPEGKKSMAYSVVFRAEEKTLTDEDVNPVVDSILKALSDQLGVTLR